MVKMILKSALDVFSLKKTVIISLLFSPPKSYKIAFMRMKICMNHQAKQANIHHYVE